MTTIKTPPEKERTLDRDEPRTEIVIHMTTHHLVVGRKRDTNGLPWVEFETTDSAVATQKCRELNEKDKENSYTLQTWTPMPRRNSD
jgi:hypothetical protein